jgi:hypothetical protein
MQSGCSPSPMVIRRDDHQPCGGEKQAGLRPLPRPQLQGSSSSGLGRRAGRVGAYLRVGRRPASSFGVRGRGASSSCAEEASSSHAGEGKLLLLGQGAAVRPPPRVAVVTCAGGCCHRPRGGGELRQREPGRPRASSAAACLARWLWRRLRCCLLPLGPGVAVCPPHGLLSCRAQVGMSAALPASPTAPEDHPRRRTPLGRCLCSWIVLSSLQHDAFARRPVPARPRGLEWGSTGVGWGGRHSSAWRWRAGGRCCWC